MSPPLPTLRALTAELREVHAADWGEYATLSLEHYDSGDAWGVTHPEAAVARAHYGREYVPGDDQPFDAVAAARRLLAAARDAGFR